MKIRLRRKLIIFQLSLLIIVTAFASIITTFDLQKYYKNRILSELQTHVHAIKFILSNSEQVVKSNEINYSYLTGYARASNLRLTLIDSLGVVVFDSNVPEDSLQFVENHLYRPEVQMAMTGDLGIDDRKSATINKPMFYMAMQVKPFRAGGEISRIRFIRLALPLGDIEQVLQDVRWKIFWGGGVALVLIAIISYTLAKRLTMPIQQLSFAAEAAKKGDLNAHFERTTNDEIGELADVLNEMLEKLRHDLIQMRKLERMRSQFLGNVSHELRTPIFAVQGYLETLMLNSMDESTRRSFINKAHSQAVRLNNLLRDLIDISRIESGEMKLNFHSFRIRDWLGKQVEEMQSLAQERNVQLKYLNYQDTSDYRVFGDQERLNQVIFNLVENAIKYCRPEGIVQVGYLPKGTNVEIWVSDTGRGIPEEHIPRIFERFYRVDKERSRAVGGTGLGLAIVKHIVEAHGSFVYVESQQDVGSTFSFSLKRDV